MKTLICIVLFFCSISVVGQNIISLTYQPTDLGIGLRYDRLFVNTGIYASISKGNYKGGELFVKDHYKTALGMTVSLLDGTISTGISYHTYGEKSDFIKVLHPVSFEIGGSVTINKITTALRMDLLKGESCLDIGLNF